MAPPDFSISLLDAEEVEAELEGRGGTGAEELAVAGGCAGSGTSISSPELPEEREGGGGDGAGV